MTISDLIAKLSSFPADTRVTLLDPDKRWLLPIQIRQLSADRSNCDVDLIAITADHASDEIEGLLSDGRRDGQYGEARRHRIRRSL